MNCRNCGNLIKENAKFCGKCGTRALPLEKQCNSCKTKLDLDELFCWNCGEKFNENTTSRNDLFTELQFISFPEQDNRDISLNYSSSKPGFLIEKIDTLKFNKNISDDEKKIVKKIKKANTHHSSLFLYDKDENRIYVKFDDYSIRVFLPNNPSVAITQYTTSPVVWNIWKKSHYRPKYYYFFNGVDAFFAWDGYLFISIYHGEICWAAADLRDEHYLPTQKANEYMFAPGEPKIKVVSEGIFTCTHFFKGKKFKVDKGILIPVE